jgi:hypothetical protein
VLNTLKLNVLKKINNMKNTLIKLFFASFLLFLAFLSCEKEKKEYDFKLNAHDTLVIDLSLIEGAGNQWQWVNRSDVKIIIDTINFEVIPSGIEGGKAHSRWSFLAKKESECKLKFHQMHLRDSILEKKYFKVLID